jgi:hypothetical protein
MAFGGKAWYGERAVSSGKRMTAEIQRASEFLKRLLANPALGQLTPLQREEQVLLFLGANQQALMPTLSSPAFLPGKSVREIEAILSAALVGLIDGMLVKSLESLVGGDLDLAFLPFLSESRVPQEKCRAQILDALKHGLPRPDFRRSLGGPLVSLQHKLVGRYVQPCFERREYVHFELTKVQRLRLGAEQVVAFVEATMLLRPLVHTLSSEATDAAPDAPAVVTEQFAAKVLKILVDQYKLIPAELLRSAIGSSVSFYDNNRLEASSRLAAIFAARGRNYRAVAKVDRGADAPDQSWLRIARRNAKAHGLDIKMVDELYRVAADNGW